MPKALLKIEFSSHRLGPGKVQLLGLIAETGSISQAAKKMKMSYRRAWLLVEELNTMFDQPVVEAAPGGSGGGGAQVTKFGQKLVKTYRGAEVAVQKIVTKKFNGI